MMSWTSTLRISAEDVGTLAENESPTGYEPNDHFITEAYVEYTQESSSEQRFLDDFDYDDVTIGKTLHNACRRRADSPVCRRQSVMIERRDSLFAHLCRAPKKLRDKTLKVNRSGLPWSDKENRFSLTVKQRFENTNSRTRTTEEVFKS